MAAPADVPRPRPIYRSAARRITSIVISALIGAAAAGVLAVHVFLPDASIHDYGPHAMLLRAHQRSGMSWVVFPVLALILAARLPRRGEVPALPFALGWTALALSALALVLPQLPLHP